MTTQVIKSFKKYKQITLNNDKIYKLIFKPLPQHLGLYYVYRVTNIIDNTYYYGSRISKKENILDDFWQYCTSGKQKKNIKNYKTTKFKVKILKVFDNSGDMIIYESFLHQYFDVKLHESFFNESNQTPFRFSVAGKKQSANHIMLRTQNTMKTKTPEIIKQAGIKCSNTRKEWSKERINKVATKRLNTLKNNSYNFSGNTDTNKQIKHIQIFDNTGSLFANIKSGFLKFCKDNDLPMNALRKSYVSGGIPIYENMNAGNLAKTKDTLYYKKYKSYYAKIVTN